MLLKIAWARVAAVWKKGEISPLYEDIRMPNFPVPALSQSDAQRDASLESSDSVDEKHEEERRRATWCCRISF